MKKGTASTVAMVLACMTVAAPMARADGPDEFGLGSRNQALGSAVSARSADWASLYYNPAGLAVPQQVDFGIGFTWGHSSLASFDHIILGYDGNNHAVQGPVGAKYDDVWAVNTGVAIPVTSHLSAGISLWSPMQRLVRIETEDPFIPSYVMWANRAQRITFNAGAAYSFGPHFRIGAGISALATSNYTSDINIPAGQGSQKNNSRAIIILDIVPTVTPVGGVQWDATEAFSFGLAYRGQTELKTAISQFSGSDVVLPLGTSITFASSVDVSGDFNIIDHFTPQQAVAGTAWGKPGAPVTVFFDVTWMNWSAFQGPYVNLASFNPIVVPPIGAVPVNWRIPPPPGFHDTFVPRLGVEYRLSPQWALRGGYSYEMTPVPTQTAQTNELDNNSHILSGGFGYTFRDPTGWAKNPVTVNAHARYRYLVPVTATKAVNYDCSEANATPPTGYPCSGSITASGNVVSGGADLTFDF